MTGQSFILFNILLAAGFVLIFLWGRRGFMRPSKLNLRSGIGRYSTSNRVPMHRDYRTRDYSKFTRSEESFQDYPSSGKSLNVLFMYNGHSWDAHEVLGVPAGSKLDQVKVAFEQCLNKAHPESKEFIHAAFEAIRRSN